MEPLFTTKTPYTMEEFMRFSEQIGLKSKRFVRTRLMLFTAIILLAVVALLNRSYGMAIGFAIGGVLFPFVLVSSFRSNVRRTYNSNALIRDAVCTLSFYEQHMAGDDPTGHAEYTYDKLYSIVETDTNFYIMISENQGSIVIKQNCTPELISFIQELKQKYGK